jgi:hypothetical protein
MSICGGTGRKKCGGGGNIGSAQSTHSIDASKDAILLQVRTGDLWHRTDRISALKGVLGKSPELVQVDTPWDPAAAFAWLKCGYFRSAELAYFSLVDRVDALGDDVNAEALAASIVEDLGVDGGGDGKGIVQGWARGDGEDFSICAGEERHDLGEQGAQGRWYPCCVYVVQPGSLSVKKRSTDGLRAKDLMSEVQRDQCRLWPENGV